MMDGSVPFGDLEEGIALTFEQIKEAGMDVSSIGLSYSDEGIANFYSGAFNDAGYVARVEGPVSDSRINGGRPFFSVIISEGGEDASM